MRWIAGAGARSALRGGCRRACVSPARSIVSSPHRRRQSFLLQPGHGASCVPCAGTPSLVLGIETSCDDTGAAVVTSDGEVLGEAIATQADIHQQWGGVVPNLAMQAHEEAIERVVAAALTSARVSPSQLSAVAVTVGPGLSLCLRVGVAKARRLSREHDLPIINVHHMEGHALVARLPAAAAQRAPATADVTASSGEDSDGEVRSAVPTVLPGVSNATDASHAEGPTPAGEDVAATPSAGASTSIRAASPCAASGVPGPPPPSFPFLCLLVSGGHNLLLLVRGVGDYVQLGSTLDDALGEAYDKTARLLGLVLKPNGGAALEALAAHGDPFAFPFGVPMRKHANCDFSYAGLKTSVRLAVEDVQRRAAARRGVDAPAAAPVTSHRNFRRRAGLARGGSAAAAAVAVAAVGSGPDVDLAASGAQALAQAGRSTSEGDDGGSSSDGGRAAPARGAVAHGATTAALVSSVDLDLARTDAVAMAAEEDRQAAEGRAGGGGGGGVAPGVSWADAEEEADGQLMRDKADIAASFQYVATLHLMERLKRGVEWARDLEPGIKDLVVAGGVAANQYIRSELRSLADAQGLGLVLPPPKWCTDNGVMIAWAGHERMRLGLVEPPVAPSASETTCAARGQAEHRSEEQVTAAGVGGGSSVPEEEWIELRPRWPLTSERHPKCMAGTQRSAKKARMSKSLTDMTAQQLAEVQAGAAPTQT